ncbi:MAG: PEGA domain-containing protein [Candidatus Omnitrophota bacterium]
MLILRKIVFYIFVLVYLVLCPLIILYSLGYIFKPEAEEHIVKTGIIYLSTLPAGASIYVNGEVAENTTPAMLDKFLPGEYDIKIFLENYEVWRDTLPVKAGEATALGKILLVPRKRKTEALLAGNFEDLTALPGTQFLLLAKGASAGDYAVYDCKGKNKTPLIPAGSQYADCRILSLFTARESSSLLGWLVTKDKRELFLWFSLSGKEPDLSDITDLFPKEPRWVMWDAADENNIFTFQENSVNRLDVKAKALYPGFAQEARGAGVAEKLVYILAVDNTLSSMNYEKKNVNKILEDKKLAASIFGDSGVFRIIPFLKSIILFRGEKDELLANRLPYRFIEKGVKGIEFDKPRERVLLWQKDRVGILDFSTEVTGDVAFEEGPRLNWIFTGGKNIKEAFWVYEASHVLFRDGSDVYLIELQPYGEPHLDRVLRVKEKTAIVYSEETGLLYYLDASNGSLASAEIVPGKGGTAKQ